MPTRVTCIAHPQIQHLLIIRANYLHLCNGDHCGAAVLSALEFLTNRELSEMHDKGLTGDPWLTLSMPKIYIELLNLYSIRTIQDRIIKLQEAGLIQVNSDGFGKEKSYLFLYDTIQSSLDSKNTLKNLVGNFADEEFSTRALPPRCCSIRESVAVFADHSLLKDIEERRESVEAAPLIDLTYNSNPVVVRPTPDHGKADEDFYELTVDNICEWVQDVFQEMGGKLYSRPIGSEKEKFLAMADQLGHDGLRGQIRVFIDNGGTTPTKFLRQMPGSRNTMRRETYRGSVVRERQSEDGWAPQRRPTQQSAFMGDIPHTDQTRDFVVRWNAIVTSCKPYPVSGSDMGYKVSSLAQARMDTDFINGFDEICRKVQAIRTNKGDEASWMSLNWLLSVKDAGANWARVLRGEFDFMAAKPERRRKSQADDVTDDLIRRLESGEYKP